MTNFEIADKIHQFAMELADLADIAKVKGNDGEFLQNLKQAYILEKEAAIRLQSESDENEWKFLFLKSAGWLALQLGLYAEALDLAELGLSGNPSGIALFRLRELKAKTLQKIEKMTLNLTENHLTGLLTSADMTLEKVKIQKNNEDDIYIFSASKDLIQNTARHLIGELVEVDLKADEKGLPILNKIRRAA